MKYKISLNELLNNRTPEVEWIRAIRTLPIRKLGEICCSLPEDRLCLLPRALSSKRWQLLMSRLVERLRDDDVAIAAAAFEVLHFFYRAETKRYVERKIFSQNDVDDAVQLFWIKLWCIRKTFNPGPNFISWLYTVRRGSVIDSLRTYYRSRGREVDFDDQLDYLDALAQETRLEIITEVREALNHLPKSLEQVLQLRFEEGFSVNEIASEMDLAPHAVKAKLRQALNRMRRMFMEAEEKHGSRRLRLQTSRKEVSHETRF
jgi:RNA polymerase sigma factor (sigma-70 family)